MTATQPPIAMGHFSASEHSKSSNTLDNDLAADSAPRDDGNQGLPPHSTGGLSARAQAWIILLFMILPFIALNLLGWIATCKMLKAPIPSEKTQYSSDEYSWWTASDYLDLEWKWHEEWMLATRVLGVVVGVLSLPVTLCTLSRAWSMPSRGMEQPARLSFRRVRKSGKRGTNAAVFSVVLCLIGEMIPRNLRMTAFTDEPGSSLDKSLTSGLGSIEDDSSSERSSQNICWWHALLCT